MDVKNSISDIRPWHRLGRAISHGHMPSEANDDVMPPGRSSPFDHDVKVDRHFVVERYDAGPLASGRNPECAQS